MKNIITSLLILLFAATAFAQTTTGFRYQTVLRDLTRQVLVDQNVSFRMSLIESSPDGSVLYAEQHNATTNQFGLVSFTIGQGNEPEGDFLEIPWGTSDIYLQVEIDPEGGSDFEIMGTSLMLAVPIATWELSDEDRSAENELQIIEKDGDIVSLSQNGGEFILNDDSPDNEIQTLEKNGPEITLTDGGAVTLNDDDSSNEIQTLQKNGPEISLTDGGSVTLNDDDASNEIQTLGLTNDFLELSNGGGFVNLGLYMDSPWTRLGFSQIYFPNRVAIGTTSFSGGSDLTVGGYMDVKGGSIDLLNSSGKELMTLHRTASGGGYFSTSGPSSTNNENFVVSSLLNYPNNGYATVVDANDDNQAGMYVDANGRGIIWGDEKNFRMDHPDQQGKEIWYASLEGPEAGAYDRGTAQLVNGEASIPFSEHFEIVINPETMTVILTPLDASSKGMAVVEKTANGFRVKELYGGTGNYSFDWEAKGVRKGFEDRKVIRDASEMLMSEPTKRD